MVTDISGQSMEWLRKLIPTEDKYRTASSALQEFIAIEATWTDTEPEGDEWAYRPYPLGKFGRMLATAVEVWNAQPGHDATPVFLEVGCGPGTKVVFAQEFMEVEATGFDIRPKYIEAALELAQSREVFVEVYVADAEKFTEYEEYDIIFLNRPFRDLDREARLDQKIYDAMRIGSLMMLGNAVTQPPGWTLLAQDVACTLWIKTCRCEGIEDVLAIPGPAEDALEYELTCMLCGRDLIIATTI